jgi:hypothetical protein
MSQLPQIQNIRGTGKRLGVAIDLFMLCLTIFDLFWLMFDAAYSAQVFRKFLDGILPFDYSPIHADFYLYDGIIVSVFIVEFIGRWVYAIYHKTYDKWFFYPFFHWYDILGCIPTSSFRMMRLFRVVGLVYRLDRWQVINLRNYAIYNKMLEYYNIVLEEISDRVAVKVLSEAKEELGAGEPLLAAISSQVIQPKRKALSNMITETIQRGLAEQYPPYRKILERHIKTVVKDKVSTNKEVRQFTKIPVVGSQIETMLNQSVSQIVFGVIDQLIQDTANPDNQKVLELGVNSLIEVLLEQQKIPNRAIGNEIIMESIDIIIERVQVQKWKGNK